MTRYLLAALCVALFYISPAFAQDATVPVAVVQDPVVTIPYGEWLVALKEYAFLAIAAAVTWGLRKLPASIVSIILTAKVDQLLLKGIQAGINQVAGASADKKMTVPIANDVVRKVVQYAVNEGPAILIKWMGGVEGVKAKVIARIEIADGAAIDPDAINVSDIKPEHP